MREITTHHVEGVASTRVFVLDEPDANAGGMCHEYAATWDESADLKLVIDGHQADIWAEEGGEHVSFQHGPIKEVGRNGLTNEALLAIVIDRLECAQEGPFACSENVAALGAVEDALALLQQRTARRVAANVEGTSQQ